MVHILTDSGCGGGARKKRHPKRAARQMVCYFCLRRWDAQSAAGLSGLGRPPRSISVDVFRLASDLGLDKPASTSRELLRRIDHASRNMNAAPFSASTCWGEASGTLWETSYFCILQKLCFLRLRLRRSIFWEGFWEA